MNLVFPAVSLSKKRPCTNLSPSEMGVEKRQPGPAGVEPQIRSKIQYN